MHARLKSFQLGEKYYNQKLTPKEHLVARVMLKCYDINETAERCHVERKTVLYHVGQLKVKLQCRNLFQLGIVMKELFAIDDN